MFKYNITGQGFTFIDHQKVVSITLNKKFLFFTKDVQKKHKVFFDIYDLRSEQKVYVGFANIDQDWIKLGCRKRNEIKKLLEIHFKSEFDIGNYRSTIEKTKKKTGKKK